MNLTFIGHEYRYAVEQTMMILFPGEKPEYDAPEAESRAVTSLRISGTWATARTTLARHGRETLGVARVRTDALTGRLERERLLQRVVRQSFYKAALPHIGGIPPWGAMTGIRPAKLASKALKAGHSEAETVRLFKKEYFVSPERTLLAMDAARASLAAEARLEPEDISLYVGIPFCPTRCVYCSFVSADVKRSFRLIAPYLEALHREIDAAAQAIRQAGCRVRTIYIGGGTPTTLTAPQLEALIGHLRRALDLSALAEFTVEAGRPDTITPDKLAVLRAMGVDRVSVNPQSMRNEVLCAMGRSHTPEDILQAYRMVRESGLPMVNMDLIAGLPQDTPEGFRYTLDRVLELNPENITVHTLALKKGARLMLERQNLPSGEDTAQMLEYAWRTLRRAGYVPYYLYRQKYMSGALENIGWCRPGTEGLYNLCIMEELHTVLALGAGGSTKLTDPAEGKVLRRANPKYPQQYLERIDRICGEKAEFAAFQQSAIANLRKQTGLSPGTETTQRNKGDEYHE